MRTDRDLAVERLNFVPADAREGRLRGWVMTGWAASLLLLLLLPLLVDDSTVYLTNDFLVVALFAMSYNLIFGQGGMLSFGHAAFYGLGAYTVALLYDKLGINVAIGLLLAPVVAALAALVVGFFSVRLRGMFFGILTMSFAQLIFTVVYGWYGFTGGDNGVAVMLPEFLLDPRRYYYYSLTIVAICVALLRLIAGSPFGAALTAIRENPQRASFIGINVRAHQLAAFVIAGAFAGISGGLRAPLLQIAFPSMLNWTQSADPVLMSLAGGLHTFIGPIIGAAVFVFVNFIITTLITGFTGYTLMVFGLLVLFIVMFMPEGIVGTTAAIWRNRRSRLGRQP
jgi:branched-chain amino acid transport system permease protein